MSEASSDAWLARQNAALKLRGPRGSRWTFRRVGCELLGSALERHRLGIEP